MTGCKLQESLTHYMSIHHPDLYTLTSHPTTGHTASCIATYGRNLLGQTRCARSHFPHARQPRLRHHSNTSKKKPQFTSKSSTSFRWGSLFKSMTVASPQIAPGLCEGLWWCDVSWQVFAVLLWLPAAALWKWPCCSNPAQRLLWAASRWTT